MSSNAHIWLYVARNGRCTVEEIAEAVPDAYDVGHRCLEMVQTKALSRFPQKGKGGTKWAYGVTADCRAPRGVNVGQVLDALVPSEPARSEA